MPRTPSPNVFLSKELDARLKKLGPEHKLARWISSMSDTLKENRYAGELIQRRQIPSYYVKRFGVNNLYRYSHPEGHRSCYTILHGCPRILDLMTHPEYDKRFGYKTT